MLIASEALTGLETAQQIATEGDVYPKQVTPGKSQIMDGVAEAFELDLGATV
jgi:hypothetical protein